MYPYRNGIFNSIHSNVEEKNVQFDDSSLNLIDINELNLIWIVAQMIPWYTCDVQ